MCVSLHRARFSDTITGTFEKDGRRYLTYQNTAENLTTTRGGSPAPTRRTRSTPTATRRGTRNVRGRQGNWDFEEAITPEATGAKAGTGNAMILPIPDAVGNIEIIDTTSAPNFLKDIRTALTPRTLGRGGLRRGSVSKGADSVRIIDFDIYRIVIAANAKAIEKVLKSKAIPDDKRPALNLPMFEAYAEWYPDWAISVWCFNNTEAKRGKPVMISYEPTRQDNKDILFVPTLDAHTGDVPDLTAEVDVDHTIFVATEDMLLRDAAEVHYSDRAIAAGIAELLPTHVLGKNVKGEYRNGDLVFRKQDLARGLVRGLRALPPGANLDVPKLFI